MLFMLHNIYTLEHYTQPNVQRYIPEMFGACRYGNYPYRRLTDDCNRPH